MPLAEILGFSGLIVMSIGYQLKSPNTVLLMMVVSILLWSTHFYMLGEMAYIVTLISAGRTLAAYYFHDKALRYAILGFIGLTLIMTIQQIESLKDCLPLIGSCLIATAALSKHDPMKFRLYSVAGESVWLGYAFTIASMSLIANAVLTVSSLIIAMLRYDVRFRPLKASQTL